MHELALYRKYRPQNWSEVAGQEHIVSALERSIDGNKVSHAYLFVGGRGTGKTSVARIFAKAIGVSANDMYEIDAASNRGIDDIRELREGIRVLPLESKYKVYIIDEAHMLSKDAWGALLKTLEEPPKHVIFILATTEVQKVPETIISRCQVLTFKKPSNRVLKNMILAVAGKEGFHVDGGGAELLAILGDGSFRDALGMLEKALSFLGRKDSVKIMKEDIEKVTGAPKGLLINDFLSSIASKNLEEGINTIKRAGEENLDMKLYMKLILEKFRAALILRYAPKLEREIVEELGEEDLVFLKSLLSNDKSGIFRSEALAILLGAYNDIDRAFIPEIPLELALIKIIGGE